MQSPPASSPTGHERTPLLNTEEGRRPDNQAATTHSIQRHGSLSPTGDASDSTELTTPQLLRVMSGVYLGAFLAALDSTLVATLSAPISASFNSMSLLSWLASAYFIANAASQPLSGKLTDIYGRRAGLVFCNISFATGNLICAVANTETVVVLGRVVAGIGGGGLGTIATFIASDLVPLRRRGLWQGLANTCFGLGSGVGGIFGGWMNDTLSWRWGICCSNLSNAARYWPRILHIRIPVDRADPFEEKFRRIYVLGAVSLLTALILLLLGLNPGRNIVPWMHPLVLTALPISAASFLAFLCISNHTKVPIIPVKLMLDRTVLSACLTNWFTTMARFGLLFYAPIYFQVQGYSATQAGLRLIPESVGVAIMSIGSGLVMRWSGRYYTLNVLIQATFLLSLGLTSRLTFSTPSWLPFLYFFLAGLGYSGILTVTLVALIAPVDQQYQAAITSASYAFRSTGSTIGITVASVVFQNILTSKLEERLNHQNDSAQTMRRVKNDLTAINRLSPVLKGHVMRAYMDALRGVFLTLFGIAIVGSVVSLFMREHKLHINISRRSSSVSE